MANIVQIFTMLFAFLTTVAGLIATYFMAKLARQSGEAAVKVKEVAAAAVEVKTAAIEAASRVEEVKRALEASTESGEYKLDELAKVAAATHLLVNSAYGAQLRLTAVALRGNAIALRRLAEMTTDADDAAAARSAVLAADMAEQIERDHMVQQQVVDIQSGD